MNKEEFNREILFLSGFGGVENFSEFNYKFSVGNSLYCMSDIGLKFFIAWKQVGEEFIILSHGHGSSGSKNVYNVYLSEIENERKYSSTIY